MRGEKGRNICAGEVEVHREQRREQERFRKKGELVLDFFKNSCDCEKLFLTRKYDVLREFRYLYFNLSLNIVLRKKIFLAINGNLKIFCKFWKNFIVFIFKKSFLSNGVERVFKFR